jgi:hypothetical protein
MRRKRGNAKMIEVGSRVMYIHNDSELARASGFYPPFGTCGTVLDGDDFIVRVQWDSGTKGSGDWNCLTEYVKEVKE